MGTSPCRVYALSHCDIQLCSGVLLIVEEVAVCGCKARSTITSTAKLPAMSVSARPRALLHLDQPVVRLNGEQTHTYTHTTEAISNQ